MARRPSSSGAAEKLQREAPASGVRTIRSTSERDSPRRAAVTSSISTDSSTRLRQLHQVAAVAPAPRMSPAWPRPRG